MTKDDGGEDGSFATLPANALRAGGATRLRLLRVVALGETRGQTVVLGKEPVVVIGRSGAGPSALVLADRHVSRVHAHVVHDAALNSWAIVDKGSRNGTLLNGGRVARAPLLHGALFRLGQTLILFVDEKLREGETFPELGREVVAESLAMLRIHAEAALVAPHTTPVLLTGESGAGKEVVAREIHRLCGRRGAFVPVNCAAIASTLAESELFGHAEGSFTGAARASGGLFAAADGGTLFLDEIAEMPLAMQPKLLRALAIGEVRPVGSAASRRVDVRVVAATNRDLDAAVAEGAFRADLYARLAGFSLLVPPLRQRKDDIIPLATMFLERRRLPPLGVDAAEALLLHNWPLNVRELELVVEAAGVRAAGAAEIGLEHLPEALAARLGARAAAASSSEVSLEAAAPLAVLVARDLEPTRDELVQVLERLDGNVVKVAGFFGKERQQIYRWAKKHGIDLAAYRK